MTRMSLTLPGCLCAALAALIWARVSGNAKEVAPVTKGVGPVPEMPEAIEMPDAVGAPGEHVNAKGPVARTRADAPKAMEEVLPAGAAPPVRPPAAKAPPPPNSLTLEPGRVVEVPLVPEGGGSDTVSINVFDGSISDVLNAFSRQTGRNIVIGPNVTNKVTLRLSNMPWEDALEVMLKPYGYGHKVVGDTIIVNKLERIQEVEQVEPLSYKVFDLRYLDAFGVIEMIRAHLTPRGHVSTITMRGQKGWGFAKGEGEGSGSGTGGKRERVANTDLTKEREQEQMRSKMIVVADIPSVLLEIEDLLSGVDRMPMQVMIESQFIEVSKDTLRDIGVQYGTGVGGARSDSPTTIATEGAGDSVNAVGAQVTSGNVQPASFASSSTGLSGTQPFNVGAEVLFQHLSGYEFEVLLHAMEEAGDLKVLSSPRILTLNNQEAAIIVGKKYPIIRSDVSGQFGGSSTSIDYWQDIGIQLNVVPQICEGKYIRMIIHPAVTEQVGTASGRTVSGADGGIVPVTDYPILSTREAETQVVMKSGERIIIGGLLKDVEAKTELKVPLLGDIPLVGMLFKRKSTRKEQLDLIICLKATVVDPSRGEE